MLNKPSRRVSVDFAADPGANATTTFHSHESMKTDSSEMTAKRFLDLVTGRIPPRQIRPEELKTLRDLTADAKVKELGVTDKVGTLIKQVSKYRDLKAEPKMGKKEETHAIRVEAEKEERQR